MITTMAGDVILGVKLFSSVQTENTQGQGWVHVGHFLLFYVLVNVFFRRNFCIALFLAIYLFI
jgi:hypothetical protein